MRKTNSLDFEIGFYEKIVREKPDYTDALILLAQAYTTRKQYRKGLEIDQRLAKLCPRDPTIFYNLACSYALLDLERDALDALEKAVSWGYRDFSYMKRDSDLKALHANERFQQILQSGLKKQKGKVTEGGV